MLVAQPQLVFVQRSVRARQRRQHSKPATYHIKLRASSLAVALRDDSGLTLLDGSLDCVLISFDNTAQDECALLISRVEIRTAKRGGQDTDSSQDMEQGGLQSILSQRSGGVEEETDVPFFQVCRPHCQAHAEGGAGRFFVELCTEVHLIEW